jgi:uncharacterized phiE125 gp8 family phage protein
MPALQLISGPVDEPLTLEELKAHLRISGSDTLQDSDLLRKLQAARRFVEDRTGPLLSQQWAQWFDAFSGGYIELSKRPILTVDSVSSVDDDDAETVLVAADYYYTDVLLGRVVLRSSASWPTDIREYNAVKVLYTAGYGTTPDSVPPALVEAVAEMAGFLYYDREGLDPVPQKVLNILAAYEPAAV